MDRPRGVFGGVKGRKYVACDSAKRATSSTPPAMDSTLPLPLPAHPPPILAGIFPPKPIRHHQIQRHE